MKIGSNTRDYIKEASLIDLMKDNIDIESVKFVRIKFADYIFIDYKIRGIGDNKISNYKELIEENDKIELILDIIKLAQQINKEDKVIKNHKPFYKYKDKYYNKQYIEVEINSITDNIKSNIIKFFIKYGFIVNKKIISNKNFEYDLEIFLRRIMDLYYNFKIWNEIQHDRNNQIDYSVIEEYKIILDEQYRKNDKDILLEGVLNNIQEKGLFDSEKNDFMIFELLYYDKEKREPTIDIMANDIITLAYYQFSHIIVDKYKGNLFKTCKYCGGFLEYERSSKEVCDNPDCKKKQNRDNVRRYRKRKKENKK